MKQLYRVMIIALLILQTLQATLYEDAEDNLTTGWSIYTGESNQSSIRNIQEGANRVIQLQGEGRATGYILGARSGGNAWVNQTEKIVKWRMKYEEDFTIYISLQTPKGRRYLSYTAEDMDRGLRHNGVYIHYGLGVASKNGQWQSFARDLEYDLKRYDANNSISSINAFLIRGSGLVDDIELTQTDSIAPDIHLNGDKHITIPKDSNYSDAGAIAIDNREGQVDINQTGEVDTTQTGTYTITYTAQDSHHNQS